MLACTAPGWSIRNTRGAFGAATSPRRRRCRRVARAPSSRRSAFRAAARSRASVVSPTTMSVALLRAHPVAVEGDQVVAGQRGDRGLGAAAGERDRVGVAFAVQQRRQHAQRGGVRARLLLLDAGDPAGARRARSRPGRSAGVRSTSANRSSDGSSLSLQRRQVGAAAVEAGAGADVGAQRFGAVAEAERVVLARAFVEHAHREAGGAELAGRCRRCSRRRTPAHLHHRHVVALGQDHLHAVGQRRALQRRELEVREVAGHRHARAAVDVCWRRSCTSGRPAAARQRRPA